MCCYNVVISSSITIGTMKVKFPTNPSLSGLSTYISQTMYTAATFSFSPGNDTLAVLKNATINKITYSAQSNQDSAFGKITLEVALPREPVRDMKVAISADFSSLLIQSVTPRCVASFKDTNRFGQTWDQGDALIDACSIANLSTATNSIVVTTKRITYKCGQSFNKTLYISIWPIIIVNFATNPKDYKIAVTLNDVPGNVIVTLLPD
jgi:hypothetical protein